MIEVIATKCHFLAIKACGKSKEVYKQGMTTTNTRKAVQHVSGNGVTFKVGKTYRSNTEGRQGYVYLVLALGEHSDGRPNIHHKRVVLLHGQKPKWENETDYGFTACCENMNVTLTDF
jgi:hypothetical protein